MRIIILLCSVLMIVGCNVKKEDEYQSQISSITLGQHGSFDEDTIYSFRIDTKGGTVAYKIIKWPTRGVLKSCFEAADTESSDKNCIYTPELNYNGSDEIHLLAIDNKNGEQKKMIIPLVINPINDAPTINNVKIQAKVGSLTDFVLRENVSDPDGDDFFIKVLGNTATIGTIECANNGSGQVLSCSYQCDKQECLKIQSETFTFYAEDTNGARKQGTISVELQTPEDSDGDYAPDYIEIANGTNPLAADLPRISSVELISSAITFETEGNDKKIEASNKVSDNGKVLTLHGRKQLDRYFLGRDGERSIVHGDMFNISAFALPEKYRIKNEFTENSISTFVSNLNIEISAIKHITNIKNISVSLYSVSYTGVTKIVAGKLATKGGNTVSFNNSNKEHKTEIFDLIAKFDKIPASTMTDYAKGAIDLAIKIDNIDFEIQYFGKTLALKTSEEIERLSLKNKRIIVASEEVGSFYSFISPSAQLNQVLLHYDPKVHIEGGKIRKLFGLSDGGVSIDLSTASGSDISMGAWTVFGDCEDEQISGLCYVVFETLVGRKQIEAKKFNQSNPEQKAITAKTKISFFGKVKKSEGIKAKTQILEPIRVLATDWEWCYGSQSNWAKCAQSDPRRIYVENGAALLEVSILEAKEKDVLSILEEADFLPISIGNSLIRISDFTNYSEKAVGNHIQISFEIPETLLNHDSMAIISIEEAVKNAECFNVGLEKILRYSNSGGRILPEWLLHSWVKNPYTTYPVKTACKDFGISFNGIFSIEE